MVNSRRKVTLSNLPDLLSKGKKKNCASWKDSLQPKTCASSVVYQDKLTSHISLNLSFKKRALPRRQASQGARENAASTLGEAENERRQKAQKGAPLEKREAHKAAAFCIEARMTCHLTTFLSFSCFPLVFNLTLELDTKGKTRNHTNPRNQKQKFIC